MSDSLMNRWSFFTREQKMSVGVLSICGIFALALSGYRIVQNVTNPFFVDKAKALALRKSLPISEAEEEARQHRMDTDGDGLSDWDEVNTHHTNPHIKDTCGDGITDNVRVFTGRNLSCAARGANVSGELDVTGITASSSELYRGIPKEPDSISVYAEMAAAAAATRGSTATSSAEDAARATSIPRNAALIRAALRGKVDQKTLETITDADLLKYYDTALEDQKRQSAPRTTP